MQRFLCWDKKNFSQNNGVTVIQHEPGKKGIALKCDDEWEGVHNGYASITKIGDKYRMYYRVGGQNGDVYKDANAVEKSMFCVAESDDGITFTKPILNKIEFNGSKANNAVFWRDNGRNLDTFTVFYDTNPDCRPEEQFKAFARDSGTDILDLYVSPDGFDFKYVERVVLGGTYDSYNVVYWDADKKEYCFYFRGYHHPDGTLCNGYADMDETNDLRDVRLAKSKDFRNWEFVDFIKFENGKTPQLYTNQITQYYREKNTLIGFPTRYIDRVNEAENYNYMPIADVRNAITETQGREGTALTDCAIMTSADGINFNLRPTAFFTPGMESTKNWWYGNCYTVYGMVETVADDDENKEISMYIAENYRIEKADFRRYTLRLDGFFSWYGDGDGATAVTKPFVLKNENMFVNFASSALGSLKITLLNPDGTEIEGYKSYTIFGNSTNRTVKFQKELTELLGKEIKIKFELNDCHLYSFTFE